jgi:hypothetical protein
VRRLEVNALPPNVVFDDRAQDRGLVRHADEGLGRELMQADDLTRCESMIARQNDDEGFLDQDLVDEIGVSLLRPQEGRVQLPGRETIGKLR